MAYEPVTFEVVDRPQAVVVEGDLEPVVVDDCTPESEILTLGDFRRVTEDMPDDLRLNFSWGPEEYRIHEISKNNIRKFLAVELTCVTLEVK